VYRVDAEGVCSANVLLARLDGPSIDDGTACEIGMFAELVERDERRCRRIVGLVTDLRLERRRGNAAGDEMNLFVAGAIEACGRICWSVDEAVASAAGARVAAPLTAIMRPDGPPTDRQVALGGAVLQDPATFPASSSTGCW